MRRVLIVDDEDDFLYLLGQFMEAKGMDHELALDAAHARRLLAESHFDLVISDLNMPGESGFDLFRYVSSHYPELRFVLMTGYGDSRTRREARSMGILGYIEKPFSVAELLKIVENLAPVGSHAEARIMVS